MLTGGSHNNNSFAGCGGKDAKKGLAVPCKHHFMPQSLSILAGVPGALGTIILAIYVPHLLLNECKRINKISQKSQSAKISPLCGQLKCSSDTTFPSFLDPF